ncbi:MAG: GatB/YqeY domain-containing protein [Candidatus Pacebacteria bacterium]|nr:GatB/YqeY domain-containing protein [Candidatus Paceibacterota bacterium]
MNIEQQIREELKESMRNHEETRLLVLKSLLSGFTNELVASGKTPQDEITDELALTVIKRAVKQRKDSIEQFKKGGREDLVVIEEAELEILGKYLPEMMSEEKIKEIAEAKKSEMGVDDVSNLPAGKAGMGILIGAIMGEIKKTGEDADGALVKKTVEELFK